MRTGFLALASWFFSLFLLESAFAFSEERADSNFLSGSNDFIEDLFYKITLGGEVKHLRNTKILKWKGQWKVLIVGDIGDKVIEIVDEQMIFLSQMTNIKYIKMARRSEEHTSELQSLMRISYDVFCLKKKRNVINRSTILTY